uniref:Uncharacterized protein n=1 Tax=Ditylenchus dipsaci TaxID=166011 RepID=A0A915EEW9_9BILA
MSLDWACPLKKLDDETWDPYENAESTEPRARHLANLHLTFDYLYVLGEDLLTLQYLEIQLVDPRVEIIGKKTTINEEFNNSEDFHWQEMSLQDTDGSLRDFDSPELNVHYFDSEHIYITNDGFEDGIFKIYQIKWSLITEKWEWTCIGGHDTADKDVQNVFQLFSMKYFNTFIHGNFLYILAFVLPEFEPDREIENLDEIEAVKHYVSRN